MTQCVLIITNIALVIANIGVVVVAILHYVRVGKQLEKTDKHFRDSQIEFEKGVQIQRRNQAESDVTQLRIKKAEFMLIADTEREKREGKDAIKEIDCRLEQYKKCRIPEIENRISELKKEKEKLGDCGK